MQNHYTSPLLHWVVQLLLLLLQDNPQQGRQLVERAAWCLPQCDTASVFTAPPSQTSGEPGVIIA